MQTAKTKDKSGSTALAQLLAGAFSWLLCFGSSFFDFLTIARIRSVVSNTIPTTPNMATTTAAPSEPEHDNEHDRAPTPIARANANRTQRMINTTLPPSDAVLSFLIALSCCFNNFFLSFSFKGLPFSSFNDFLNSSSDL
ncbi:MAG TPA: hypothetical protein VFP97_01435 [Chitinophagaceae bacterium]|nr:hypothetical protein [Chitinophagaceae bacterium]